MLRECSRQFLPGRRRRILIQTTGSMARLGQPPKPNQTTKPNPNMPPGPGPAPAAAPAPKTNPAPAPAAAPAPAPNPNPAPAPAPQPVAGATGQTQTKEQASGPKNLPKEDKNSFIVNFKDVELEQIIKTFSDITGKNFILEQIPKGKITIVSPVKIPKSQAINIFEAILNLNGYNIVATSIPNLYRIVPIPEASQIQPADLSSGAEASGARGDLHHPFHPSQIHGRAGGGSPGPAALEQGQRVVHGLYRDQHHNHC